MCFEHTHKVNTNTQTQADAHKGLTLGITKGKQQIKVVQSFYELLLLMTLCFPIHLAFSLSVFELMTL